MSAYPDCLIPIIVPRGDYHRRMLRLTHFNSVELPWMTCVTRRAVLAGLVMPWPAYADLNCRCCFPFPLSRCSIGSALSRFRHLMLHFNGADLLWLTLVMRQMF
jgi:hypothetical protein